MKYASWLGVACVALIAAGCAPNVYNSGTPGSSQAYDVTDFNGEWRLVTRGSDYGSDWLNARNNLGVDDWGTDGATERVRYGAWFLPDEFRIDSRREVLRIEDENGGLIAELPLDSDNRDGTYRDGDYNDRGVRARWLDDNRFEVERVGRNGRRVRQTFTLEDRGRQLVVGTVVERDGSRRTYTRVYDRA